ncbi:hypothetical protein F4806DRAFT_347827 [Annulohypoxylon nitens]|nr:hypothetical protein F4806DRAFT_347827 [Annulohypoxylon nitens]
MAPDTLSLEGKVAIITGSGRENGIGAGIAMALARNGAKVTINYISEATAPRAAEVVKNIQAIGGKATAIQADISSLPGATRLVDKTLEAFHTDKVDILVNNAGFYQPATVLDVTKEALDKNFGVMVYGPVFSTQAVVPYMPRGGRIVNVGSGASKLGNPQAQFYTGAKAAMDAVTFAASMQLGRQHGITINTVMPGPVSTDAIPLGSKVEEAQRGLLVPMTRAEERFGTVEDIADAVLLLVQEKSRWITGQTIGVNGGITGN